MNRAPAFQFYADDFIGGTVTMTNEERGLYIMLLCLQWTQGSVSEEDLQRLGLGMANGSLSRVRAKFAAHSQSGELKNERLEKERAKQTEYRKKQAENGKLGGRPKTQAFPKPNPTANPEQSSPSPSPSPSPKDNKKRFKEPSIEEVKLQCAKIGLPDSEAERFWNYHAAKGWVVGNQPMRSWVAALNTWKLNGQKFNQGARGPFKAKSTPTRADGEFCPGWQDKDQREMTANEIVAQAGGL